MGGVPERYAAYVARAAIAAGIGEFMRRIIGVLVCAGLVGCQDQAVTPGSVPVVQAEADITHDHDQAEYAQWDKQTGPVHAAPPSAAVVLPLFAAAAEATEEAIYNAIFKATTVTSSRGTLEAIPVADLERILKKYNALGH